MLCPKCKTELSESILRCGNCGMKVKTKCPVCAALNKVTALKCESCAHELLRKCSACGAYNLPTSAVCRKCSSSLTPAIPEKTAQKILKRAMAQVPQAVQEPNIEINEEPAIDNQTVLEQEQLVQDAAQIEEQEIQIQEEPLAPEVVSDEQNSTLEEDENCSDENDFASQAVSAEIPIDEKSQIEIKTAVVNALMNTENVFCAITGKDGTGKSHVLKEIANDLQGANVRVVNASATPVSQLSPYGVFQDLFISIANLPDFFVDGQQKESDFIKQIENAFGITSSEASELFALLYPSQTSYYEDILYNRSTIRSMIKSVILSIKSKGELVLVIDDFDLIDTSSFELLSEIYADGFIDDFLKILVTVQSQKNVDAFIQAAQIPDEKYGKFYLGNFTDENIAQYTQGLLNNTLPFSEEFLGKIVEASNGSPLYTGQLLLYMNESNMFSLEESGLVFKGDEDSFEFPVDCAGVVSKRLENIKGQSAELYKALVCIAILGSKFSPIMLQAALGMEQAPFENIANALLSLAFVTPINENSLCVQSSTLWRYLYDILKNDELYASVSAELLQKIAPLRITSVAYKPLLAQYSGNDIGCFEAWSQIMRYASFLGDVHLYVIAQKQCLKLNSQLTLDEKNKIDTNIKMRLGKLLCESEPTLALEFLSTILSIDLETEDYADFIDIASYSVLAANKAGNYNAVVEIVDNVVKLLQPAEKYKLEIALVNARKVKTMLYLGNFEHLINTIENDIKPPLEDALSQNYTVYNLPISKIFETWLEVNFVLADAYVLQGSSKVYNIVSDLEEAIASHSEELEHYKYKLILTKAFVSSMKGEVAEADRLMNEISANVSDVAIDVEFACKFNIIQALNRFMKKDFSNMRTYLYEVVTFANNNGDNLSKNLLKSGLGKLLENEGDFIKALEIYNDQITYFAKERVAVGALLNWFLLADLKLKVSEVDDALNIALNALDVAKNPRINSYYFQVMYKRLIAEIYLIKGDFDAAKMYLEKALLITKKFNLEYQNVLLYDCYAKYHIELFKAGKDGGSSPLVTAKKLYEKAINIASKLGALKLVDEVKHEYQSLMTFAQLKKISLS